MLPSRRYEPAYPPPRNVNAYGQNIYSAPPPHPQQQQQSSLMNQHQPLQQQQQQQQEGHANGQPGSVDATSMAGGSGGLGGQEMNLASVLHYLQSEWRRWERDRNEWEIERAEMRARIALLEGQRRSAENLKVDLLRRVKMLEFALRQERTKQTGTISGTLGRAAGIAPSKLASLQEDDRLSNKDDKEGSDSGGSGGGSEERDEGDRVKINGSHAGTSKSSGSSKASESSPWKNIGAVPRDPKSRARSREYLKQCLQEITYLTSPGALNPLPNRPLLTDLEQSSPKSGPAEPEPERPTKSLPSRAVEPMFERPKEEEASAPSSSQLPNGIKEEPTDPSPASSSAQPSNKPPSPTSDAPKSHLSSIDASNNPPSSPLVRTKGLPDTDTTQSDAAHQEHTNELLTAIYRPESKAAWREELRAANEKADRTRKPKVWRKAQKEQTPDPTGSGDEQLSSISLSTDEEEVKPDDTVMSNAWASKRMLRGHLDVVRSVSITDGIGTLYIASGGDDNTVKIWTVETASLGLPKPGQTDLEPIMTYRGHTAAVTSVLISDRLSLVFSASLDSSIRIWKRPAVGRDPYGPYDPSLAVQTLVGHTDAIWGLCLLPASAPSTAPLRQKGKDSINGPAFVARLASCSADGTVKIWTKSNAGQDAQWALENTITGFGTGVVPTCVAPYHPNYNKILVGRSDGTISLHDIDGQDKAEFGSASSTAFSQVNCVMSHPNWNVIIGGYEDGHLRIFDPDQGLQDEILAHTEAVTSVTNNLLEPKSVVTSSSNCSMRVWDLEKKISTQDLGGHRQRSGEGVCQVSGDSDRGALVSAGADGIIRLWAPDSTFGSRLSKRNSGSETS